MVDTRAKRSKSLGPAGRSENDWPTSNNVFATFHDFAPLSRTVNADGSLRHDHEIDEYRSLESLPCVYDSGGDHPSVGQDKRRMLI